MAVSLKQCIQTNNNLEIFIKKVLASAIIDIYDLPENKYRDYAEYEEMCTGINVTMIDRHGFGENYYLTWDEVEHILC